MSTNTVTWDTIKGYFRPIDIAHMKDVTGNTLNLSDCKSVQHWAKQILVAVSPQVTSEGTKPPVMPPGGPYWTQEMIHNFQQWIDEGAPCSPSQTPPQTPPQTP